MKGIFLRAALYVLVSIVSCVAALSLFASCGPTSTGYRRQLPPEQTQMASRRSVQQAPARSSDSSPVLTATKVIQKPLEIDSPPRTVIHEVAPMESLWRISKIYGVSMASICQANKLTINDTIEIGQKLVIPNARKLTNIIPLYPSAKWRYVIVHHTGTMVGKALLIHMNHQHRGFDRGLGYHFLIDNGSLGKGDGQIEVARRWIKQQDGAHCRADSMNSRGIGIGVVGNFNNGLPSEEQINSLVLLINTLCDYYHIPRSNIMGHGQVNGASTDCPGKRFPWPTLFTRLNCR